MKLFFAKISTVILVAVISLCSCTKGFKDLNKDPTRPTSVTPSQLITGIEKTASDIIYASGVNCNLAMLYAQYYAQTQNESQSQYQLDEGANNQLWTLYSGPLSNIQELKRINQLNPDPGAKNQNAIGNIISAWLFQVLTDSYGNVPFSEALKGDELQLTPKYDDSKAIYDGLVALLDEQISALDNNSPSFSGGELIYNGSPDKWKMLANSLKLRIGVRMLNANPAKAKTIIEQASKGVFTSIGDEAKFPYLKDVPDQFPFNDQSGIGVSGAYFVSSTVVNFLKETGDPRLSKYARIAPTPNDIVGKPYGLGDFTGGINRFSLPSSLVYSPTFPGYIVSYAEVQFNLAEAAARGLSVGGNAATFYENGVRASMQYWGVSNADANAFLVTNPYVASNWKNIIGSQKWIALYNQGLQAWFTRTRLNFKRPDGKDFFIVPATILDNSVKTVPFRITYPLAEQSNNRVNYEAAKQAMGGDNKGIKLWWQE